MNESRFVQDSRANTNSGAGSDQSEMAGDGKHCQQYQNQYEFFHPEYLTSVRHRVHRVIDAQFDSGAGLMNRTLSDIQRLPVFTDIVVEVDHNLQIALSI